MASFSVPCPKVSPLVVPASSQSTQRPHCIASFPRSDSRSAPALMTAAHSQGHGRSQSNAFKVCAQLSEVAAEKISNGTPAIETVPILESGKQDEVPDASSFSAFMDQVKDLVKLVDSKDIVELQLNQMDCEILIRKKEALPQPSIPSPVFMTPPQAHQSMLPAQPVVSAPSSPIAAPALPAPTKPKSSHPPFKCPMAGNFYRSSAPGSPPFVKVGDKVQKGQVLCIIEAMKLMNEIEADHSGTIAEILADDGKPVSVDTPLFVIAP